MIIESHPLQPFLPTKARILFLGSFPPPHDRWSMEFFYPNFRNDFWRVMGLCFYADALHFEVEGEKRFDVERVTRFAEIQGFAFYDTATQVCRLRNNLPYTSFLQYYNMLHTPSGSVPVYMKQLYIMTGTRLKICVWFFSF